jgi:cellobiose-specific phosphotransferase system component IIA
MCLAATGGNAEACLRLANFYYLISFNLNPVTLEVLNADSATNPDKGRVAAAEERLHQASARLLEAKNRQSLVLALLFTFWYRLFPLYRDYQSLAFEWYNLASVRGNAKACLLEARLIVRHGKFEQALELLDDAEKDRSFAGAAVKLRQAWLRGEKGPKVPDGWFNV